MIDDSQQQPDELEKSLGDQVTGADLSHVDRELSLGDQSTSGDALSSLSDLSGDLSADLDDAMPIVDLTERYEIQESIGKGGMGEVLRALDTRLKRPVAIKRVLGKMTRSKKALSRFLTEAQSIAALNHFNIVQIYDYGRDAEGPFIIMELVEGESLQEKLKAGKLEIEEAVDITCQLCDALGKAHGAGIIHRDIKPANILLTEDGTPKLTDFGLARQQTADHGQTQAGAVLGTIDFMPPEQRLDATATDARSDLWSLAATFYQMVTGKSPKIIHFKNVPQALQGLLEKALEEEQDDRYQTAQEFRAALKGSLTTTTDPASAVSVDLGAGECAGCHTRNEASRKFCRECAEPLRVACLACEKEIPVWDKVCPECGGKQPELAAAHRSKLSSILETSLTLSREYEYEKALSQLEIVTGDKHATTGDLRQQAAKQIAIITPQRDEQYQLRDQLVELAAQHQQNHDYASAVQELEKIPAPLRTGNKIAEQLSNAQAARDEIASLEMEIRDAVRDKRIDGLLEKVTRFLELNPEHEKIQELHKQLLQQQQKAISAAAKLATSIKDALAKGDWQTVLRLDPNNCKALGLKASAPITNTLGMTFNKLPAGTFMMGSPVDETDREDGEHQHEVTISKAFYMQTTEVTQGQWKAVMGTEPWKGQSYVKEGAHYPATYVRWDDAVAYCKNLSEKEGKTYRLPTEAQWEYACRAGTGTRWSFGDDEKALGDYAWYWKNAYDAGERYAHQVRLKKPNQFGLYDMHGNVWEWCYDYYGKDYFEQSPEKDPTGPTSGSFRVLRGGSWDLSTRYARSAVRGRLVADYRSRNNGFRLVRELD
jgi:formylglycine-generating enzyme required for sulfatase activity/serine/threonine protein kinase